VVVKTSRVGHVKTSSSTLKIPKGGLQHLDNIIECDINALKRRIT